MTFVTLPKATRGFWNYGTGQGEGKIIEKLLLTIEDKKTFIY